MILRLIILPALYFIIFSSNLFTLTKESKKLNSSLIFAQVLFRHGARSPIHIFPTDVNQESAWPQGFGQLTKLGVKMQYNLGKFLRKRYVDEKNLLSSLYKVEEIYVRSTDIDRTLMSAESNLAGLYPPGGSVTNNGTLFKQWQPIPVHTVPDTTDNLLSMGVSCPVADKAVQNVFNSSKFKNHDRKYMDFYKFVSNMSGIANENIKTIWSIWDTIICETTQGMNISSWINSTWSSPSFNKTSVATLLKLLSLNQFDVTYSTPIVAKLRGGVLLKKMLTDMKDKIHNKTVPLDRKFLMYSAHDSTLSAFMAALGVFNGLQPPFASCVFVELYKNMSSNQYYVEFYFKNHTNNDILYPLKLSNCSLRCPFEKFLHLMKSRVPDDWEKECFKHWEFTQDIQIIVGVGSAVLLLVVIIIIVLVTRQKRKRPDGYWGIQNSETM